MRTLKFALLIAILSALNACAASTSPNAGGTGGTTTTSDAGSDSGTGSGTTTGDASKNKASVSTTSDSGSKDTVTVDKAAAKADAEAQANKIGAVNADKQLVLWMTQIGADGSTKIIEVHVNTEKYQLPAAGIPVGAPNSDAWVTYSLAGATATGIYTSAGTGTIDITSCPAKSGQAVTGKFNGVVVNGDAVAMGAKSYTLDGSFNLVFFGMDGSVMCKPVETGGGGGGSVDVSKLKPPAGSTCDANPCDGGSNTTRNCCPYVPCMSPCMYDCSMTLNTCTQGCMADPMNAMTCVPKCMADLVACNNGCLTKCNVSATCKAAAEKYYSCEDQNSEACSQSPDQDACLEDKCCGELKAAF